MARMIPPVIDPSAPRGERRLFDRFKTCPGTEDWVVLHSLGLGMHRTKHESEADFVVVAPGHGVLCIEVKSHSEVSRDSNGVWTLGKNQASEHKDPIKQASTACHSTVNYLKGGHLSLADVPVEWCLWFTNASTERLPSSIEWKHWQVADIRDVLKPVDQKVTAALGLARRHFARTIRGFQPAGSAPDSQTCKAIVERLRPRFDLVASPAQLRAQRQQELATFTLDQCGALDMIEENPRSLITGPAGTGKTWVAMTAVERAIAEGLRVRYICYNRLLAYTVAKHLPGASVGTLHRAMQEVANSQARAEASAEWFETVLPDLALEALLDQDAECDLLVIDEAQDLCGNPAYLDVLDAMVVGGLSAGRWLMFGDFERQALYGQTDGRAALGSRGHFAALSLPRNCRNTPRIGKIASQAAGRRSLYRSFLRDDDGIDPEFRNYRDPGEQTGLLRHAINDLTESGYASDEIVILSPKNKASIAASTEDAFLRTAIAPYGSSARKIGYTTIHAFKGLDAPAVIVTDIERAVGDEAEALLYVALSRATDRLTVIGSIAGMNQMIAALKRGASNA